MDTHRAANPVHPHKLQDLEREDAAKKNDEALESHDFQSPEVKS